MRADIAPTAGADRAHAGRWLRPLAAGGDQARCSSRRASRAGGRRPARSRRPVASMHRHGCPRRPPPSLAVTSCPCRRCARSSRRWTAGIDPRWAESWDAVGLVCGDPDEPVERILLAVDAVPATVDEAIGAAPQLLITHHPLLLTGVHGVPADDPKGAPRPPDDPGRHRPLRRAHQRRRGRPRGLRRAGRPARLRDLRPLEPRADRASTSWSCSSRSPAPSASDRRAGRGGRRAARRLRPLRLDGRRRRDVPGRCAGAQPGDRHVGEIEAVRRDAGRDGRRRRAGARRCSRALRRGAPVRGAGLRPARDGADARPRGALGRVGALDAPTTLARVRRPRRGRRCRRRPGACAPPATPTGRSGRSRCAAGRAARSSSTRAAAGADVFLTADLKHHPAVEAVSERAGRRPWRSSTPPTGRPRRRGSTAGRRGCASGSALRWTSGVRQVTDPVDPARPVHRDIETESTE